MQGINLKSKLNVAYESQRHLNLEVMFLERNYENYNDKINTVF
jgi:hypothetical protein